MVRRKESSDLALEVLKASALDALVAIDARGDVVAWNGLAEAMFGWHADDAMGRSLAELIMPERYRTGYHNGMDRFSKTGAAGVVGGRIEIEAIDRIGREFPIELAIVPAPPGGAAAFIGFIRDISARKAAQARLAVSEESLRLATEAAEVGTWDLDLLTDTLTWSDRTKAMFGVSPDVACSMVDFYEGLHPEDRAATSEAFASAIDPEVRGVYDVQYRTIGKEDQRIRWVAAKGKGLFDANGQCIRAVGTAIDITARKIQDAQNAVMLEVTDLLRGRDTSAGLQAICGLMGRYFAVSRVGFGLLDPKEDIFDYSVCWTDGLVPPLLGEYPAHAFGTQIVERLSAGETVVVNNLFEDRLSNETTTLETAAKVDTRAILVVPFLRNGRLRTIVYLNSQHSRIWTADEINFMQALAERARQLIDRAEAEAEVAAREAEFRTFAQAMPNLVWASAPDGTLNWFNERTYEYCGARPGDLDGDNWNRVVHPDDWSLTEEAWRTALEAGTVFEAEFRIRRLDGVYRWHISRAVPIRGPNGKILRWVGTNTDVDDQKVSLDAVSVLNANLEQQVVERTEERDQVWQNSQDLLVILDETGIVLDVNPSALPILGWDTQEVVGRHLLEFVVEEDQRGTAEAFELALAGKLTSYDNRLKHKDGGSRWLSWAAAPGGNRLYASGRHITRERESAEELAHAQEALRQAQKMEAVGQLTGGIAHDFNNMLAVVSGSLELLDRRIGFGDARARSYVASAREGAKRAASLTQRLLAFARQQPLQPEIIDVNRLVAGMSDLLRHSIGAVIRLEMVQGAGLWRTHADPNQLENVILNLGVNARDAMPDGGRLTIETSNAHIDARYTATEPGVTAGQYVLIAMTDTGSGMPPEVIAKAFDPFFTTKAIGKGTGLGLSQVYGFVKQSGGHIKIYSEVGHGTTIKIYLPRDLGNGEGPEETSSDFAALLGEQQEVILVVDDEAFVREFSVAALSELGYRVLPADGAETALKILSEHPEVSLLFTDVVMPDKTGKTLADEARQIMPQLKVLYTTGYTRNAVVHNGVLDPGVELIGKPFSIDELAVKVREILDKRF